MTKATDGVRILPRQDRARAVIDAVLEAATQLLELHGETRFNTNAVAERAGVSIGTLYRYFANKEAVLMALAERETDMVQRAMREALTVPTNLAPDRAAIRAFLAAFQGRTTARNVALRALLAGDGTAGDGAASIEALLRDRSGKPLPALRAFVLTRALLGAVRAAVLERPLLLAEPTFEDELVKLARSYANVPQTFD
jgi:AcrR family transcriptional regulator